METAQAATDIHFEIVCCGPPPEFESPLCEINVRSKESVNYIGLGKVNATFSEILGEVTYHDPMLPDEVRSFGFGAHGRLIPEDEYVTVSPTEQSLPGWFATDGHITFEFPISGDETKASLWLSSVTVIYTDAIVAYTREMFHGPQMSFLPVFTPNGNGGAKRDRAEAIALYRRTTVRDLKTSSNPSENKIAVVYDGIPHSDNDSQALWLGISLLAGQNLQPIVVECYDRSGNLVSRKYRLGAPVTSPEDPPFHIQYAPFCSQWLGTILDGIKGKLDENFPIDVMIGHINDATDGSMERRMQSHLFALHTASEAWALKQKRTLVVAKEIWKPVATRIAESASAEARVIDSKLAEAVRNSIHGSNNIGTAARMRSFCTDLSIMLGNDDEEAVGLRNKLFHDGYLQRRFRSLSHDERQKRFDQMNRLRDLSYRATFAIIGLTETFHSALKQEHVVSAQNGVPRRIQGLTSAPIGAAEMNQIAAQMIDETKAKPHSM